MSFLMRRALLTSCRRFLPNSVFQWYSLLMSSKREPGNASQMVSMSRRQPLPSGCPEGSYFPHCSWSFLTSWRNNKRLFRYEFFPARKPSFKEVPECVKQLARQNSEIKPEAKKNQARTLFTISLYVIYIRAFLVASRSW